MIKKRVLLFFLLTITSFKLSGQSSGEVMFVGFNADGNDGISFATLVSIANGTTIFFTDNEWNGGIVGSGGAFNTGEGFLTWTNSSGANIEVGTVITITDASTTPIASIGSVSITGTFAIRDQNEVIYMYLGTSTTDPTTFLSAIANDGFANGPINNTGLTTGSSAIALTGDEDIMTYNGSIFCKSTVGDCSAQIANTANWITEDGGGDQSANATAPDFPDDVIPIIYFQITYYSSSATSGGNWNDNTSWTTVSDGSGGPLAAGVWPSRGDNVVILAGHTITIDATDDNRETGVSPTGLGRTNVGGFSGSGSLHFYHLGDITIENTGTLESSVRTMFEGHSRIEGSLDLSSAGLNGDFVILGSLEITSTGSLAGDDIILSGNSSTIIDASISSDDDIIIDHTDATLCGSGVWNIGSSGESAEIFFTNSATSSQICDDFSIGCNDTCVGVPFTGTGSTIVGNTGPGGVGLVDGASEVQLWFDASDLDGDGVREGSSEDGLSSGDVTTWVDKSGYGRNMTSSTDPSFIASHADLNSMPAVDFDRSNEEFIETSNIQIAPSNALTMFYVFDDFNFDCLICPIANWRTAANVGGFTIEGETSDLRNWNYNTTSGWSQEPTAGWSTVTPYIYFLQFSTDGKVIDRNGTNLVNDVGTNTNNSLANFKVARHSFEPGNTSANIKMSEILAIDGNLNDAQVTIISNYLSAKYNISISGDEYSGDASGFDFDVAGIGQAADASNHTDAKGPGEIRIWNPNDLDNSEFLMWGHDNALYEGTTTDVDGTMIEERIERIWSISETGDVGTVSISFDLSALGNPLGSNLMLMIDRDGDGFSDNDVTPVIGSVVGDLVTFSGIDLQDGDQITLGNADITRPLPVELNSFNAHIENKIVVIQWSTNSELNNDYFSIERSIDSKTWQVIAMIDGVGNSNELLSYQHIDKEPIAGQSFYRLRQTDFDGKYEHSRVVRVEFDKKLKLKAFPNPSDDFFTLSIGFDLQENQIEVIDLLGKYMTKRTSKKGLDLILDASNYPDGMYIIKVNGKDQNTSIRIVKR